MQIGLIGLQNTGKTTLFKTLTGPEHSGDSGRAVVRVPDARLDHLTELFNPKKQVNATLEVVDIPGLTVSDDGKMRITSDFLSRVKNNDALLHIVREFQNDAVPHPTEDINRLKDIDFLETEFLLTDLTMIENRIEKMEKEVQKNRSDKLVRELQLFKQFKDVLEQEQPLRSIDLDENDRKLIQGYQFLTMKPIILGINFSEDSKDKVQELTDKIESKYGKGKAFVVPFFGQFEYELAQLSNEEAELFKQDMGIEESALSRILRTAYEMLGLQSFLTAGEDECRAWTIRKGYTAQEAAGTIHTDFYNKFIRAEVVHYDDYVKYGSFPKCKEAGVWRLEGKEYIVKDGDILSIRHS